MAIKVFSSTFLEDTTAYIGKKNKRPKLIAL